MQPPNFRFDVRSNLSAEKPEKLLPFYIRLTEVELAFKAFKNGLPLRPIFHPPEERIEAHIFASFLA